VDTIRSLAYFLESIKKTMAAAGPVRRGGVPVSVFCDDKDAARILLRFAFCKRDAVLKEAVARLGALAAR